MRSFLNRIRYSLAGMMRGRYGSDKLNMAILLVSVVFSLVYMFTRIMIFNVISVALLVLDILRMFSKNIPKRYEENRKFEQLLNRLKTLKTHHIYKCSSCGQKIRVPRLGGKRVEIRCPKCGQTFVKKV